MPSANACGDPYEPLTTNTDAITATPSAVPNSRIALWAPEAWPASSGGACQAG
jgi:hypothetical protein